MTSQPAPLEGPDLTRGVSAAEITEGRLLLGHADGEPVVLTRARGALVAVGARCPHYGGPLHEGLVVDGTLRCPWHHAAFDLQTGAVVRPPALDGLSCWRVEEHDGLAVVVGRRPGPSSADPAAAAVARLRAHRRSEPESIVILGGGAAGSHAAITLRREGYTGPVTLVEAGPDAPYDRPNLSKDYLAGSAPEEWIPLRPEGFWAEQGIELLLGRRATELDGYGRRVTLDDGTTRTFGALLIATGAEPIRLDFPGAGQPVHYLRTLADSRALVAAAARARRAVVLGASFIGFEVAAALRARGLEVAVVAPEGRPMERILGPAVGDFVRALHEEHGVRFHLGRVAATIEHDAVTLSDGTGVAADLVVAGVGVYPATELAEAAGLAVARGILVDEYLETSTLGIYAAGDLARWPDPHTGERVRVEHWVVAQRQGQTAARNMLATSSAGRERFDAIPFFWSQHYDVTISYAGHASAWDSVQLAGDLAARDCVVTYRSGHRVLAVATIGRDRASLAAEAALEHGHWPPLAADGAPDLVPGLAPAGGAEAALPHA
ncbi:MAG TPA: FAD-dependent oxidoreductase [Gemmatimonadales bacterium]|nr:FAD-dependent oxidoreductase [Gemmatimonadales bacterium]